VNDTLEPTARRIADHGREALVARLRPAFAEAAAAHADVIALDDEQIERMVQSAADRADGLQWRRALAGVAVDELGIGLAEALDHPAVQRAQEIAGAPSYEDALAGLTPARAPDAREDKEDETDDQEELEPGDAGRDDLEPDGDELLEGPAQGADDRVVTFRAVHVDGMAGLASPEPDLRLTFSGRFIEVSRRRGGDPIARLPWTRIQELEVASARGRLGRRRREDARIIVRGEDSNVTFEIPGVSADEARSRLEPIRVAR
jgi:hypothetical protein